MPTTTNHDNQIAAFLARQPYVDAATKSSDEPQVIFKGALDLDVVQENNLVTAALKYREGSPQSLAQMQRARHQSEDIRPTLLFDSEGMTWMQERCLWDLVSSGWDGIIASGAASSRKGRTFTSR